MPDEPQADMPVAQITLERSNEMSKIIGAKPTCRCGMVRCKSCNERQWSEDISQLASCGFISVANRIVRLRSAYRHAHKHGRAHMSMVERAKEGRR